MNSLRRGSLRFELGFLAALIVLLNLPLLHGACAVSLIFEPERVAAGEWWRVFSHPFVHVSWYHLMLDATAFLLLYRELDGRKWFERVGYMVASGAASLLVSLWAAPLVQTRGLCGLSGIAHGLMTVSALEMIQTANDKTVERAGMVTFIIVITKSIVEAATGHVAFKSLHFGDLGSPIAISHAGGVLGALGTWAVTQRRRTANYQATFKAESKTNTFLSLKADGVSRNRSRRTPGSSSENQGASSTRSSFSAHAGV